MSAHGNIYHTTRTRCVICPSLVCEWGPVSIVVLQYH